MNITEQEFLNALISTAEFQRIVRFSSDLKKCAEAFPEYADILNKSTVAEVLAAIIQRKARIEAHSKAGIEKNVTILFELSNITKLPTDLMVIIAAMTGNRQHHNEQSATQIGYKQNRRCELDAALPSLSTMINHHRLLNGLNSKQEKTPQEQREFDKRFGLTIVSKNNGLVSCQYKT